MIGHITNSGGNNSLMKHDVVQGNNIVDLDLLRNFNGVPGVKSRKFYLYQQYIFKYKTTERKKSCNKYVS